MSDDVPAALPLLFLIAGLGTSAAVIGPYWTAAALLMAAGLLTRLANPHPAFGNPFPAAGGKKSAANAASSLRSRMAVALAFFALGVAGGARDNRRVAAEQSLQAATSDRFVAIEAPIDRDWSARGESYVLRCRTFTTLTEDGRATPFDAPIAVYARFQPRAIELESRVRATGFLHRSPDGRYSLSVKSPRLLAYRGRVSSFAPATWNRLAALRLRRYAGANPAEVAMIEALVLGRGERLSEEARQSFRRGGTYHLLVFSGMQIALAAAIIAMLLRWIGSPRASDWSLLLFALGAPLFIGPTPSVLRSSIGIGLYASSRIAGRPTSFENLWCVAAILDLVVTPVDLSDPAFHLTYAGAGALIFLGRTAPGGWRLIASVLAAEVAVVPLTLFHFHQYALGGSIMTVILTPVIFVMLIAGAGFCALEIPLLLKTIGILNAVCLELNAFAAPASGFFAAPSPGALSAGLVCAIVSIAFASGRRRTTAIAIALAIPICNAITRSAKHGSVGAPQVTFLDVGQGDAILVRSGARSMLVDGGGRAGDSRFGDSVLLPLLADRGVRVIDVVVLSHAHPDHCGGIPSVLREMRVGEIWLNPRRFRNDCAGAILEALRNSDTVVRLIRDERRIMLGEMSVHAFVARRPFRRAAENNSSVVLRIVGRRRSVLLTGDIEREAEAELSSRIAPAQIMKVPHHGSRSSTTAALLDAVKPKVAVISCGERNWFGHPHGEVIDALSRRRVRILRTDRDGTVQVDLPGPLIVRGEIDRP